MDQVIRTAPRLHPLLSAAAVSIIAASAAGVGVLTGVLPTTHATAPAFMSMTPGLPMPAAASIAAPIAAATPVAQVAQVEPTPRAVVAPRPRPVRVAAAPVRQIEEFPDAPARQPVIRTASNDPYPPNPYGGNPYGRNPPDAGGAYGNTGSYGNKPAPLPPVAQTKPACTNCGVVESVAETTKAGAGTGLGMAGGAIGGAVVGKQFGNGRGSNALAILGALGGAYAGHQVEKSVRSTKSFEVQVRMEDGSLRTVNSATQPSWRQGDRVRVDGGSISGNLS